MSIVLNSSSTDRGLFRRYVTRNGNVIGTPTSSFDPLNTATEFRDSVRTPNFRALTKELRLTLPMNPFTYEKQFVMRTRGYFRQYYRYEPVVYHNEGCLSASVIPSTSVFPELGALELISLDNMAVTKLLNKIKDQKVNYLQALAERQQTAALLAQTATRIAQSFAALKKGDIGSAGRALGVVPTRRVRQQFNRAYSKQASSAAANGWLELQYGWKPLLNDVYGSAELLAQKVCREVVGKETVRVTRKLESNKVITDSNGALYGPNWGNSTYSVKYVCYFSVRNESIRTLSQLGFTNPALIAWELLPYSFVVDWFLPIGNFLSSLDATLGMTFLKGTKTTFQKSTGRVEWVGINSGPDYINDVKATYSASKVRCQRVVLTSFPSARFPSFKNPISITHALNAIALLNGTFNSLKTVRR